MMGQARLLYIMGSGHSGSTLLDLMLGSHSQIESGGEVYRFGEYFAGGSKRSLERRRCTCGEPSLDCGYWKDVLASLKDVDATAASARLSDQQAFDEANHELISACLKRSGKHVFCDSSKDLERGRRLFESDRFDTRIVHLIRDPRAVAYSNARKRDVRYSRVLVQWWRNNQKIASLGRRHPDRYSLVRYEDLVSDTRGTLEVLMRECGLEFEPQQLRPFEQVHHNLSGNRMRFNKDQAIRWDGKYLQEVSGVPWILGSGLSRFLIDKKPYPFTKARMSATMQKTLDPGGGP